MITKKILVTGGNGFIGNRLIFALKNNSSNKINALSRNKVSGCDTFYCDFLRNEIPDSALKSVDVIFHLAGFAHDFRSNTSVKDIYKIINIDATIELAKLAIKNKVKKFVFVSSVKAGGKPLKNHCNDESHQFEPDEIYGKTKREAEIKLLKLSKNTSMDVVIVRPSLVYGNGMKGNLRLMLSGVEQGWFPPLPKIKNKRSMVHVDDLVQALILLSIDKRANNEIFIVTDGYNYSSREIYEAMCSIVGKKNPSWAIPLWFLSALSLSSKRIKFKVDKLIGDEWYSSKKIEALGFKPKNTIIKLNEN